MRELILTDDSLESAGITVYGDSFGAEKESLEKIRKNYKTEIFSVAFPDLEKAMKDHGVYHPEDLPEDITSGVEKVVYKSPYFGTYLIGFRKLDSVLS